MGLLQRNSSTTATPLPLRTANSARRSLYTETIKITVGTTAFGVHSDIIRHHSTHFRDNNSDAWKEIQNHGAGLPALDVATFRLYIDWLYSQTPDLASAASSVEYLQPSSEFRASKLCYRLCNLWLLAGVLGDTACKNNVIKTLIRENALGHIELTTFNCQYVYDKTDSGSGLRKWLIDTGLATLRSKDVERQWITLPEAMQVDLMKLALGRLNATAPQDSDAEKYYE